MSNPVGKILKTWKAGTARHYLWWAVPTLHLWVAAGFSLHKLKHAATGMNYLASRCIKEIY
jgi:hypothetical protein